jgi:predicted AAA+ superfamily ATPase
MWIDRDIEQVIAENARQRPALILTGSRQAGKTSLLQRVFSEFNYVSLDVPLLAEQAEESGSQFLRDHPAPLVIDEAQYAPQLFRYLKLAIDGHRDKSGQYCLTGSQKFPLMQGITESLAGRVAVLNCHSLSVWELERWSGQIAEGEQLLQWIFQGGYPELHDKSLDPQRFYADYLSTYLERDVRQVLQIKSLRDFDRFMRLAAIRSGQLLSYSSFASDLGVSPNTVKSWISVLEASNILFMLEPYYRNLGKRLVKTPKLFFLDTGLACFLAGLRSPADLRQSGLMGAFFETHVVGQMVRWYANRGRLAPLYFYRDHYGREVDLVIPVGERLKLFECKWSEMPSRRVKGFDEIIGLIGEENVLSRSIITPMRGLRRLDRMIIEDSVEIKSLEE